MRTLRLIDITTTLGLLGAGGLALACKPAATEVPASTSAQAGEASCRHELGRCGGHVPGDGSCGATSAKHHDTPATIPLDAALPEVRMAPGEFAEINLDMPAGAVISAEFTATGGVLAWNVHSHEGDKAVIHQEGTAGANRVRFTPPAAGVYSYMWTNEGTTPVTLRVTLQATGAVKVLSVHSPG